MGRVTAHNHWELDQTKNSKQTSNKFIQFIRIKESSTQTLVALLGDCMSPSTRDIVASTHACLYSCMYVVNYEKLVHMVYQELHQVSCQQNE